MIKDTGETESTTAYDQAVFARLREDADFELSGTVLERIEASASVRVLQTFVGEFETIIKRWFDNELIDKEQLRKAAHTIKGSAGNIGARKLSEIAASVEKEIQKEGITENFPPLIESLQNVVVKLKSVLADE